MSLLAITLVEILAVAVFILVMCLAFGWILTRPRERPRDNRTSMYEERAATPEGAAALARARKELDEAILRQQLKDDA